MQKPLVILMGIIYLSMPTWMLAQPGGQEVYSFLRVPISAQVTAMGGAPISPYINTVGAVFNNVSLLDSTMHQQTEVSYRHHLGGASHMGVLYGHSLSGIGNLGISLVGLNHGTMAGYDEYGNPTNDFTATDFATTLYYSNSFSPLFTAGGGLKVVASHYEAYSSWGIAMDLALRFTSPDQLLTASFALRNAGWEVKNYTSNASNSLPLDVELSVAKRMAKAPFGFSVSLHSLQQWRLYTPRVDNTTDGWGVNKESRLTQMSKEALSHLRGGVSLRPSRHLLLMAGYDFERSFQLSESTNSGLTGFSFGASITTRRFSLSYGWTQYHPAASSHQISLILHLHELL